MGIFLLVVGVLWALLGVGNLVGMFTGADVSETLQAVGVIVNMVLFVLPGLVVAGIGEMLRRKKAQAAPVPAAAAPVAAPAAPAEPTPSEPA